MTHNRKRSISLLTALIIFTLAFTNSEGIDAADVTAVLSAEAE